MIKVVKFGGSSLASAAQFKKVELLSEKKRQDVMWFRQHLESRHSGDTKVTDLLINVTDRQF